MGVVHIYIDTDLKGPRRGQGAYMYIMAVETAAGIADTGKMETVEEETTENGLTLMALSEALQRIHKPCDLSIHMECPYVAAALQNRWYEEWRANNWMNKKNEVVKDAEKWRRIEYLLNAHGFEVHLKEPHTYREWMKRTLKEGKICDN